MSVLLFTYDLNKEKDKRGAYEPLYKVRNSYPYAKLSESSYALYTNDSPKAVYDKVNPYLDSDDALYVINLRRPYFGQGSKQVNDWLEKYLP
jgi:hypothetical protein